jgi:hypothetical protein
VKKVKEVVFSRKKYFDKSNVKKRVMV